MYGDAQGTLAERQDSDGPAMPLVVPPQGARQTDEAYRAVLVDAIAFIDKTKRDIKAQVHSAAITAKAEKCGIDQVWLRRAKDKIDHLTREREDVRRALGDVNRRIKDCRIESHGRPKESIAEAFMRLAKVRLLPDVYEDLLRDAEDVSE